MIDQVTKFLKFFIKSKNIVFGGFFMNCSKYLYIHQKMKYSKHTQFKKSISKNIVQKTQLSRTQFRMLLFYNLVQKACDQMVESRSRELEECRREMKETTEVTHSTHTIYVFVKAFHLSPIILFFTIFSIAIF